MKKGIRFIGVRFILSGSLAGLHGTLRAVEAANPFLLVTFVRIQPDVRSAAAIQTQLKMEIEVPVRCPPTTRKPIRDSNRVSTKQFARALDGDVVVYGGCNGQRI